jgi:hypothetical protein
MTRILFGVFALMLTVTASAQTVVKFDDLKRGPLPAPWQTGVTGKGTAK